MRKRILWIVLLIMYITVVSAQESTVTCFDSLPDLSETCQLTAIVISGQILAALLETVSPYPTGFVPPEGAGNVIEVEAAATEQCALTPSTGRGSGVYIRSLPNIESNAVGDIPLGGYRTVTAISRSWYQVETNDGKIGFVSAEVSTLVGPCGDIPQFVVTP